MQLIKLSSNKPIQNTAGVYGIMYQSGDICKTYIGSSVNLQRRLRQHKSALRHNKHINSMLQRYFNKYGEDTFYIKIIEDVESADTLAQREIYYIDLYRSCKRKYGFNMNNNADRPNANINNTKVSLERNKEIKIWQSITQCAADLGICHGRITEIMCGKREHYKEWHLPGKVIKRKYKLRSPSGCVVEFDNSTLFAREHGLDSKGVNYLLRGLWRYHREWTCPEHEVQLLDPNKNVHILNRPITQFCKRQSLAGRADLTAVITGQMGHYKGWTLHKAPKLIYNK